MPNNKYKNASTKTLWIALAVAVVGAIVVGNMAYLAYNIVKVVANG